MEKKILEVIRKMVKIQSTKLNESYELSNGYQILRGKWHTYIYGFNDFLCTISKMNLVDAYNWIGIFNKNLLKINIKDDSNYYKLNDNEELFSTELSEDDLFQIQISEPLFSLAKAINEDNLIDKSDSYYIEIQLDRIDIVLEILEEYLNGK